MALRKSSLLPILALGLVGCSTVPKAPCSIDYSERRLGELETIAAGEDVVRSVLRGERQEADLTDAELARVEAMEVLLTSRSRTVDRFDIAILEHARSLLDPASWDREDDRECVVNDSGTSLFCALRMATIAVDGAYSHRRTALQEVRFAIEDIRPGVEYDHRLMDFNNAPDTSFDDVIAVLSLARERAATRLAAQARCES